MRRDVEVFDGEENEVRVAFEIPKSRGPILYDCQNAVDALTDCVGQGTHDERHDVGLVLAQGADELDEGWDAALEGGSHPVFQEHFC